MIAPRVSLERLLSVVTAFARPWLLSSNTQDVYCLDNPGSIRTSFVFCSVRCCLPILNLFCAKRNSDEMKQKDKARNKNKKVSAAVGKLFQQFFNRILELRILSILDEKKFLHWTLNWSGLSLELKGPSLLLRPAIMWPSFGQSPLPLEVRLGLILVVGSQKAQI